MFRGRVTNELCSFFFFLQFPTWNGARNGIHIHLYYIEGHGGMNFVNIKGF